MLLSVLQEVKAIDIDITDDWSLVHKLATN